MDVALVWAAILLSGLLDGMGLFCGRFLGHQRTLDTGSVEDDLGMTENEQK